MTNPKRARVRHVPRPPRAALDHPPIPRITRLGASLAVIHEVERRWAALDLNERQEVADAMASLTDEELAEMLAEQEAEIRG